jgi:hypothetical protein
MSGRRQHVIVFNCVRLGVTSCLLRVGSAQHRACTALHCTALHCTSSIADLTNVALRANLAACWLLCPSTSQPGCPHRLHCLVFGLHQRRPKFLSPLPNPSSQPLLSHSLNLNPWRTPINNVYPTLLGFAAHYTRRSCAR